MAATMMNAVQENVAPEAVKGTKRSVDEMLHASPRPPQDLKQKIDLPVDTNAMKTAAPAAPALSSNQNEATLKSTFEQIKAITAEDVLKRNPGTFLISPVSL